MTRALPIALLVLIGSHPWLHAQSLTTPFYAAEGLSTAEKRARAELAGDAKLIFLGTLGDFTIPAGGTIPIDLALGFYLDSMRGPGLQPPRYPGQADAWIYLFRSADSGSTLPLIVVKVFGTYQAQTFNGFPFPAAFGGDALGVDEPYSGSGAMTLQLAVTDSVFRHYHAELPGSRPDLITYGQLLSLDSVQVPIDFLNGPVWTMTFTGGADTSMTCFVSARTGSTLCRRVLLPSSVSGSPAIDEVWVTLVPNPSDDHVRVCVRPPANVRGGPIELCVVDARGERVMTIPCGMSTRPLDVEIATTDLASGVYFVTVDGGAWHGAAGLIVADR